MKRKKNYKGESKYLIQFKNSCFFFSLVILNFNNYSTLIYISRGRQALHNRKIRLNIF